VYYCQDCGGANPANATTCRICGLMLIHERGGAPCQSCGAPTVAGARFCSICGTATVALAAASLAGIAQGGKRVDTVAAADRPVGNVDAGPVLTLSEGLELPDWLKRAATEQPFDPGRQAAIAANPYGPPSGSTGPLADDPTIDAVSAMAGGADPAHLADRSGDDVMRSRANPAPAADVSDTSTFISEDDLPEWIRQLAAADEAKKAEEMQRAAEASAAVGKPALSTDPRRRRPLPGETPIAGPATSPWLARRERTDVSETVAADSWGGPAAADGGHAARDVAPTPVTIPASTPEVTVAEQQPAPTVSAATKQPNQMRLVLLAAVVLVVVALVAFMALS
jgi:hypothetical protein